MCVTINGEFTVDGLTNGGGLISGWAYIRNNIYSLANGWAYIRGGLKPGGGSLKWDFMVYLY